jgi:hypothetical protein
MRPEPATLKLISQTEAARQLGITPKRVRAAVARKQIHSVTIGNRRMIPISVIQRLLEPPVRTQFAAGLHTVIFPGAVR